MTRDSKIISSNIQMRLIGTALWITSSKYTRMMLGHRLSICIQREKIISLQKNKQWRFKIKRMKLSCANKGFKLLGKEKMLRGRRWAKTVRKIIIIKFHIQLKIMLELKRWNHICAKSLTRSITTSIWSMRKSLDESYTS